MDTRSLVWRVYQFRHPRSQSVDGAAHNPGFACMQEILGKFLKKLTDVELTLFCCNDTRFVR